jgi:hypothetical protein
MVVKGCSTMLTVKMQASRWLLRDRADTPFAEARAGETAPVA